MTSKPFPKTVKLGITGLMTLTLAASVLLPMAKGDRTSSPNTYASNEPLESGEDVNDLQCSIKIQPTEIKVGQKLIVDVDIKHKTL